MTQLAYPSTYSPQVDGEVVSATNLQHLFYDQDDPDLSLAIVNGFLDADNLTDLIIEPDYVQRGAFVTCGGVAGTANLDYRWDWFSDYDTSVAWSYLAANLTQRKGIPGAIDSFYVAETARVRLAWTIMWTNDSGDEAGAALTRTSRVFLSISAAAGHQTGLDGDAVDGQIRVVNQTIDTDHEGYHKNRVWSGHHLVTLARGWYNAGLYLVADKHIKQTRVWCRSMSHMILYG